jgi:hypothetical protein
LPRSGNVPAYVTHKNLQLRCLAGAAKHTGRIKLHDASAMYLIT